MTLLGVLLALALERMVGHLPLIGEPLLVRWTTVDLQRYLPWKAYWSSGLAPCLALVTGMLITYLVQWLIPGTVPDLVFSALILLFAMGPRDLTLDIRDLIRAHETQNVERAKELTQTLLMVPDRRRSRRALIGALFIQSHERVFGVLIWFFLLGPVGAVAYRIASRQPRFYHQTVPGSAADRAAQAVHAVLAWIPTHLSSVLYLLSGSTDSALEGWRRINQHPELDWKQRTWARLAETAAGSLAVEQEEGQPSVSSDIDDCLREVIALQGRALLIMLASFAVFTAGGWIA